MICKHLGTLGPSPRAGDVHEIRCLNRLIRWTPGAEGWIEWEPDARHTELLLSAQGLNLSGKEGKTGKASKRSFDPW